MRAKGSCCIPSERSFKLHTQQREWYWPRCKHNARVGTMVADNRPPLCHAPWQGYRANKCATALSPVRVHASLCLSSTVSVHTSMERLWSWHKKKKLFNFNFVNRVVIFCLLVFYEHVNYSNKKKITLNNISSILLQPFGPKDGFYSYKFSRVSKKRIKTIFYCLRVFIKEYLSIHLSIFNHTQWQGYRANEYATALSLVRVYAPLC